MKFEKRRKEYEENPKKCIECGILIPYEKRNKNDFCTRSCANSFNNRGVRRYGNPPDHKQCQNCGKLMVRRQRMFCDSECYSQYAYKDYIAKWLNGEKNGLVGSSGENSRHIKRWLIEQRGNFCEECGWDKKNPSTQKVPLHMDHIDGNADNCVNDNLRLLCPNCHSLTSNFGHLNLGNGRKTRKKMKKLANRQEKVILFKREGKGSSPLPGSTCAGLV